jgi:hypothetical protein
MVNYTILRTSDAKPFNTKVVHNRVLHGLINCGNFWMSILKYMKKRRVGAAVLIGSANGRGLNVGFGAL